MFYFIIKEKGDDVLADFDRDSMLEMFIYEMSQLLEQLEQEIIQSESGYPIDSINEIFRIMHTIKGSASMMMFNNISDVAHSMEDLFYYLREENPIGLDYALLTDLVLEGMDFIKVELSKIESGSQSDGDGSAIIASMKKYLAEIKGGKTTVKKEEKAPKISTVKAEVVSDSAVAGSSKTEAAPLREDLGSHYIGKIWFEDGCEMENIRAYTFIHNMSDKASEIKWIPEDIIDEASADEIRKNGFYFDFYSTLPYSELESFVSQTIYLKNMELEEVRIAGTAKRYEVLVKFEEHSEMENIRAFTMVHNLEGSVNIIGYNPEDLLDDSSTDVIKAKGFSLIIESDLPFDELQNVLSQPLYLEELTIKEVTSEEASDYEKEDEGGNELSAIDITEPAVINDVANTEHQTVEIASTAIPAAAKKSTPVQHVISVNVGKLDILLNLMGELVIAEAMVTQNPELVGLELESFVKEARQLHKIITDIQDTVMTMRMVPLQSTFFKMHRIVRDMCRSLNKEVELVIIGEDTEVDKNIIEHISDPIMHIIRNSIDHGIEMPEERKRLGKPEKGIVTLEAKNTGGDVLIIIKDDGKGLDKEKIMDRAKNNGLLKKDESEYTDKEIHQFIMLPGFSTNEKVTNFSGRGVGMDVVATNLEVVGGSVIVDSHQGEGSLFTLKIPLTLAIIEGMNIKMGNAIYTIPIISIKRSFKATASELLTDPSGNEMIKDRGEVYNVVRLYEFFGIDNAVTNIEDGIMIQLENGDQTICLFVDELIGEQQVVVKSIPKYIKKIRGISGCTLLGNGDISLIIDGAGFFDK